MQDISPVAELGRDAGHKAGVEAQHNMAWYRHKSRPHKPLSLDLLEASTNGRELNRVRGFKEGTS